MVAGRPAPARALVVRGRAAALRPARQERRVLRRPRLDPLGRDRLRARAPVRPAGAPARDRVCDRRSLRWVGARALRRRPGRAVRAAGDPRRGRLPAGCSSLVAVVVGAGAARRCTCARRGARLVADGARPCAAALSRALPLQLRRLATLALRERRARRRASARARQSCWSHSTSCRSNSLLDARGRIDAIRFPHFARLARGSTWFSRATTVAEGTTHAVPAILTGQLPARRRVPDLRRPPQEPVHAASAVRRRCTSTTARRTSARPRSARGSKAPSAAAPARSPRTRASSTCTSCSRTTSPAGSRRSRTAGTTSCATRARITIPAGSTRPSSPRCGRRRRPTLWYLHLMLPHSPWRYLPSGARYDVRAAPGWGPDEVWNCEPGGGRPVLAAPPAAARLRGPRARPAARPTPGDRALRPRAAGRDRRPRRQLPRGPEAAPAVAREPGGHRLRAAVREAAGPAPRRGSCACSRGRSTSSRRIADASRRPHPVARRRALAARARARPSAT